MEYICTLSDYNTKDELYLVFSNGYYSIYYPSVDIDITEDEVVYTEIFSDNNISKVMAEDLALYFDKEPLFVTFPCLDILANEYEDTPTARFADIWTKLNIEYEITSEDCDILLWNRERTSWEIVLFLSPEHYDKMAVLVNLGYNIFE